MFNRFSSIVFDFLRFSLVFHRFSNLFNRLSSIFFDFHRFPLVFLLFPYVLQPSPRAPETSRNFLDRGPKEVRAQTPMEYNASVFFLMQNATGRNKIHIFGGTDKTSRRLAAPLVKPDKHGWVS